MFHIQNVFRFQLDLHTGNLLTFFGGRNIKSRDLICMPSHQNSDPTSKITSQPCSRRLEITSPPEQMSELGCYTSNLCPFFVCAAEADRERGKITQTFSLTEVLNWTLRVKRYSPTDLNVFCCDLAAQLLFKGKKGLKAHVL